MCSLRGIETPLRMTGSNIRGQDCYGCAAPPVKVLGRFILPFSNLLGRWIQQFKKRDAMDSDKLIKLSLLSIICIAKKKNLNFLCTV
jgi:hypothetical protein